MEQTNFIARILQLLCRALSIVYFSIFVYSLFCLVTGLWISAYGEGRFLHISYPFTETTFLNVDNSLAYLIFSFLLILFGYAAFFYLAGRVFRAFMQSRIFTPANIKTMRHFYLFNIFLPLPAVLIASFFVEVEGVIWILVGIHFILGIFSLFLANIFRQGVNLQNDQDLII
ncbi:MAG: hypothetical protein K0S24_216 [Sphingobacterium sp.]|jgi:hypothetical protein|nr:hypothetical protein [Sphingobacterium sp.]